MSRFYVRPEDITADSIHISGPEAHHVLDVMRLKRNDEVIAFDGLGNEYTGVISETEKKSLVISIQDKRRQPVLGTKITLAQAIPKSEKMDYIVQKCTELGVQCIIPMITERTIVKIYRNKEIKRQVRWTKIATEAAKQCGRSDIPEIRKPSSFKDVLKSSRDYTLKIMPSLIGERKRLLDCISRHKGNNAIVFIGPEGGFSSKEVKLAQDHEFNLVSLGPYTLKTDTAALTAVAILNSASKSSFCVYLNQ